MSDTRPLAARETESPTQEASARDNARRRQHLMKRKENAHRTSLLVHLDTTLELLITVQMTACYYLDNSFLILILRIYGQQMFKQSQPETARPTAHAYFARLFGLNVLAAGLHIFFSTAPAGEATRGYSHGGFFLDFVGQHGPALKMQLLLYDIVILVLQLLYLDVFQLKQSLAKQQSTGLRRVRRAENIQVHYNTPTITDMDAEERGTAYEEEMQQDRFTSLATATEASNRLYTGVEDLGTFVLSQLINDKMQATDLTVYWGASSVLSNVVSTDIRRRRYTLNVPFRT